MAALLLLAELIFLYLLSRWVIQMFYSLMHSLTQSRTIAIWVVSIIFFPGTVIHELAHLFTAEILGVQTGKLTLVPESLEGSEVKTGGVMIAQTDPFRRTLIGLAPVSVGVAVLAALSYFIRHALQNTLVSGVFFYLLFSISNSMFSSKEDMKGVIPFTITVALFAAAGYIAGFRLGLTGQLLTKLSLVIETLVRSLGIVLAVNLLVLAATSALLAIFSPRHRSTWT